MATGPVPEPRSKEDTTHDVPPKAPPVLAAAPSMPAGVPLPVGPVAVPGGVAASASAKGKADAPGVDQKPALAPDAPVALAPAALGPVDDSAARPGALPVAADLKLLTLELGQYQLELTDPLVRGELGAEVAMKRLVEIGARLAPIIGQILALAPADRTSLAPLARQLLHMAMFLGIGRQAVALSIPFVLETPLTAAIGNLKGGDPTADVAAEKAVAVDGGMELGQITAGLQAAYATQVEHFKSTRQKAPDVLDTNVIARLAGAKQLLAGKFADPEKADQLRPQVEAIADQVKQLARYVDEPGGPGLRDLLIRTSDVMEGVGLGPRLTTQTMKDSMSQDAFGDASPADIAAFEAAVAEFPAVLTLLYGHRANAVSLVEADTHEKDPEEVKPWWQQIIQDVVMTALSLATAGIAGKILGPLIKKGGGAIAEKVFTQASNEFKTGTKEFVEKVGEKVIDMTNESSWDFAKDKVKEPADSAGSATSTYLKNEFFQSQKEALTTKQYDDHSAMIAAIQPLRTELGKNAGDKVQQVHELVAAFKGAVDKAGEEQASHTRVGYATMLAQASLSKEGDDAGAGVKVDRSTELEKTGRGSPFKWYKDNVAGMISLEMMAKSDDAALHAVQAWAHGLNDGMCEKLQEDPSVLSEMPVRLRIMVVDGSTPHYLSMARDAGGAVSVTSDVDDVLTVRDWLAVHAGVASETVDPDAVARKIMNEEIVTKSIPTLGFQLKSKG